MLCIFCVLWNIGVYRLECAGGHDCVNAAGHIYVHTKHWPGVLLHKWENCGCSIHMEESAERSEQLFFEEGVGGVRLLELTVVLLLANKSK